MNRKDVVVIIPTYKEYLNANEFISVHQAFNILGKYDICFIAPERLRACAEMKKYNVEYFSNIHFAGVSAYSRLLLDIRFYERFLKYKYMLIYQMDAFVFDDKLLDFCEMGYDYIGAPLYRSLGWPYNVSVVGNGGLSLRKIESCIRLLKKKKSIYGMLDKDKINKLENAEDRFFTYCGTQPKLAFKIAPLQVARNFAMEKNIRVKCKKMLLADLPFGCHGWSKPWYYGYWRNYIQDCGYDLSNSDLLWYSSKKYTYFNVIVAPNIVKRLSKQKNDTAMQKIRKEMYDLSESIIWGKGIVGLRIIALFNKMGWKINTILDMNATDGEMVNDIPVIYPSKTIIKKRAGMIIIATSNFRNEIAQTMMETGLEYLQDFIFYDVDVEAPIAKIYFEKVCKKWAR